LIGVMGKNEIMKPKHTISIGLIFGMLLGLSLMPKVKGQPPARRFKTDTGVVRLGPGQVLRLIINGQDGADTLNVSFRRMFYAGSSNGGVWKGSIVAQDMPASINVGPHEAASTDASQGGFDAVRIEALIRGYTGATTVNAGTLQIINSDGSVASFVDAPGGVALLK
jgi:hypothetical protein